MFRRYLDAFGQAICRLLGDSLPPTAPAPSRYPAMSP